VHQPTTNDVAVLTPCSLCGTQPSARDAERVLQQEARLIKELSRINNIIDSGRSRSEPVGNAILSLKPAHPHHYLSGQVYAIQAELYKNIDQPKKAAEALMHSVECREAIVCFTTRETAFKHEYHGDYLQMACSGESNQSVVRVQLMAAQKSYRHAIQLLLLLVGPSHPYSNCVTRKLLAVQSRLRSDAIALGLEVCNFCGGKGVPHGNDVEDSIVVQALEGKALPRCGRCGTVSYCCPEHQRAQWRLHKAACAPPPQTAGFCSSSSSS